MDPCPVYEKKSGTIFLFFLCVLGHTTTRKQILLGKNAVRLCCIRSRDAGHTWSQAQDLTNQLLGTDLQKWATFGVGPGHGLQLRSGRLVIPAYAFYIHGGYFPCFTKPHCLTFYSDDGGQNWSRGHLLESLQASECQVAELTHPDGSSVLYLNGRGNFSRCRACAFSGDGGVHFDQHFLCRELHEPPPYGCQGSVVSFCSVPFTGKEDTCESTPLLGTQPSHKDSKPWLMFSHPTCKRERLDLGIYLNTSPLDQVPWKAPWVLYKGPSGYSDLAVCEEEEEKSLLFGCLFECGVSTSCDEIAFQLFSSAELLRNVREQRPFPQSVSA